MSHDSQTAPAAPMVPMTQPAHPARPSLRNAFRAGARDHLLTTNAHTAAAPTSDSEVPHPEAAEATAAVSGNEDIVEARLPASEAYKPLGPNAGVVSAAAMAMAAEGGAHETSPRSAAGYAFKNAGEDDDPDSPLSVTRRMADVMGGFPSPGSRASPISMATVEIESVGSKPLQSSVSFTPDTLGSHRDKPFRTPLTQTVSPASDVYATATSSRETPTGFHDAAPPAPPPPQPSFSPDETAANTAYNAKFATATAEAEEDGSHAAHLMRAALQQLHDIHAFVSPGPGTEFDGRDWSPEEAVRAVATAAAASVAAMENLRRARQLWLVSHGAASGSPTRFVTHAASRPRASLSLDGGSYRQCDEAPAPAHGLASPVLAPLPATHVPGTRYVGGGGAAPVPPAPPRPLGSHSPGAGLPHSRGVPRFLDTLSAHAPTITQYLVQHPAALGSAPSRTDGTDGHEAFDASGYVAAAAGAERTSLSDRFDAMQERLRRLNSELGAPVGMLGDPQPEPAAGSAGAAAAQSAPPVQENLPQQQRQPPHPGHPTHPAHPAHLSSRVAAQPPTPGHDAAQPGGPPEASPMTFVRDALIPAGPRNTPLPPDDVDMRTADDEITLAEARQTKLKQLSGIMLQLV